MTNLGKIQRLTRELVAVLEEEFGLEDAAQMLEHTAAQLRATGQKPGRTKTPEKSRSQTDRKLPQAIDLKG